MTDVTLPDGSIATFPDEMSDADITKAVSAHLEKTAPASNTWTGIARGFGQMLGPVGEAEMVADSAPIETRASAPEIANAATNFALNGHPAYQPQSPIGKMYQNFVANTTASAPFALMGGGGIAGAATRLLANAGSNAGGEVGEYLFPNHPILGRLGGGIAGGFVGGGLGPKSSSPTGSPQAPEQIAREQSVVDQLQGNYAGGQTPSYIEDLIKSQQSRIDQLRNQPPPAPPPSPSLMSRFVQTYNRRIPEEYRFIPPLLLGEGALAGGGYLADAYDLAKEHPYAAGGVAAGAAMLRGATQNPAQALQGIGAGLIPYMLNYRYDQGQ